MVEGKIYQVQKDWNLFDSIMMNPRIIMIKMIMHDESKHYHHIIIPWEPMFPDFSVVISPITLGLKKKTFIFFMGTWGPKLSSYCYHC